MKPSLHSQSLKISSIILGSLVLGFTATQGAPINITSSGTAIEGYNNTGDESTTGTPYTQNNTTVPLTDHIVNSGNYVATFGGGSPTVPSYVGFSFATPTTQPITSLEVNFELIVDGGWFGASTRSGAAGVGGQPTLSSADLTLPTLQIENSSGVWSDINYTSDYLPQLEGQTPGSPSTDFVYPTPLVTFNFDAQEGISGIRLIGPSGGTSGFIAINEEAIFSTPEPRTWTMTLLGMGILILGIRRRITRQDA